MRVAELGEKILGRLNRSSAQWQQFGFMGDIALVNHGKVTYLEDLPVQFAHRSELADSALYLVITLEFGKPQKNVFSIKRKPSVGAASQSAFLHPVVRLYSRGGKLRKRLDLLENLFGEWTEPERHLRPLLEFLRANVQRALNSSMPRRLSSSTSEAKL